MKKIIAIGILGIFLLTSVSALSADVSLSVKNTTPTQDLNTFDTNNCVSQRTIIITDEIVILESDADIILIDDTDNGDEGGSGGNVNNGLPDFVVSEFACWCTIDTEGTAAPLPVVFGHEFIVTNIGDSYEDENGFLVYIDIFAIYPDFNLYISGFGGLFTKWGSGAGIKGFEMNYFDAENPTLDLKPESIKIEISTAIPESSKDNNVRIIPCEWGVFVSGIVYKKEILKPKEPIYAFVFFEADDPQYFDNYYMLASNDMSFFIPFVENGTYWISAPARQSEYTLRAYHTNLGFIVALLHYDEILPLELIYRLLSKAKTIGPVEPNDHINLDFVFQPGLFGSCFLAGTEITMADGSYKNIEDIEVGDLVKSYDLATGETTAAEVTKVYHHEPWEMTDHYLIINNQLKVTPNHLLYIDGMLIPAGEAQVGDLFTSSCGSDVSIDSIQQVFERVPTYNFELESDTQMYFVGEEMQILALPLKISSSYDYYQFNNQQSTSQTQQTTSQTSSQSSPSSSSTTTTSTGTTTSTTSTTTETGQSSTNR